MVGNGIFKARGGRLGSIFILGVHYKVHDFRRTSVLPDAFSPHGSFLIFNGRYPLRQEEIIAEELKFGIVGIKNSFFSSLGVDNLLNVI